MILEEERNKVCEQCGSPLASSAGAPGCLHCLLEGGLDEVDERRFEHYEIELCPGSDALRELGRGAMGITYRATDLNLGASVALKVISARYSNQVDARERFHEEARVAARLRHPNVASVFHFGETPSRRCFYAMELVEGETLEERVRREVSLGAALVLEIATQVARALLAAAKHGLVHRDLKPSNLMLLPNEQGDSADVIVKVIDFGLAKTIQEPTREHSAQSGFSGTPGFASPEQTGAGLRTLDVRSDIYSLGATLRHALTGRPPPEKNAADPGRPVQLADLRRRNLPEPLIALLRSMLADDPAGRPQSARELLHAIENCRRQLAAPKRRRWLAVSALMAISALAGGFGLTKLFEQDHRATVGIQDAPPAKSIAVLPFENLSDEKENSNFANGIQDEILSDLARIADLKVISRTSVMQYKSGAPRNSREIGRQLGVSLLLEGSVQRVANQVRVNAQLIDARTDAHLWAQTYDRDVADVFAIQSEIAEGIADQLRSKLSPTERAAIAVPPTTNLAAYQLYTEALTFEIWNNPAGAGAGLARRADLLHQATQLDPTFAAAYCLLANTECDLVFHGLRDHLPLEKAAAETALRLQPNLGEAHREMARYYETAGLFSQARAEIAIARRTLPNDSQTFRIVGNIEWATKHWDAATANMEQAFDRDPHNLQVLYFLSLEYRATRRYGDWRRALARESDPDPGTIYWAELLSAELDLNTGDAKAAQTLLDRIPESYTPTSEIWSVRVLAALYLRDYPRAFGIIARVPARYTNGEEPWGPAPGWGKGLPGWNEGDAAKSQAMFASVRWDIDYPSDPDAAALLHAGLSEAGAGRKEQAMAKGRAAIATTAGDDPFSKADAAIGFAKLCAILHENSAALALLQTSATQIAGITYGDLQLDPSWDGLRGDSRFKKLVASLQSASSQ